MSDYGTIERQARGDMVEELRQNESGVVTGAGLRAIAPRAIDRLYHAGVLGDEPDAGRRHQAGLAFAELHLLVHPSAGVGRYSPIARGSRKTGSHQELSDQEAAWDAHLKSILFSLPKASTRLLCNVCARDDMPGELERSALNRALDELAEFWGLG
ncbi:hypothetical protein [Kiloniella sp. b19]|uniref:hypothetical protein n=1 Tax=Kiloniella sp. GXU_MW_B19 TaxID=3141326 RepID=UPI0031DB98A7